MSIYKEKESEGVMREMVSLWEGEEYTNERMDTCMHA